MNKVLKVIIGFLVVDGIIHETNMLKMIRKTCKNEELTLNEYCDKYKIATFLMTPIEK